ncbi:helix-turn-helix domain-containing protein [Herbaspirillum sp.]|uniref:helix-turn-helix domain-containing protein n=1 Tax=Herbaspirillum sp. TaxID=1890675 RepID=UPI001B26C243|nr:helix-turn-helix domain-containing protein [Herbaspirillum sp.]MBO9535457.1 helix-turn-helix transcriptional regulator [Herbaspirillum sp.]
MAEDFIISISTQLREHLRALRKQHGLTQAQLGERTGVSQARIAEIEANPGVVSFDQLQHVLSTLGASLRLHMEGAGSPPSPISQVAQQADAPYDNGKPATKKQGSW